MYLDGYVDEGLVERSEGSDDPTVTEQEVHRTEGTTITERQHSVTAMMEPGEIAAFGIPETTLE